MSSCCAISSHYNSSALAILSYLEYLFFLVGLAQMYPQDRNLPMTTFQGITPAHTSPVPRAELLFSRSLVSQLFVTLWTEAHSAPLSLGFFQGRVLEWVAISFCRESSWTGDQTGISCMGSFDAPQG